MPVLIKKIDSDSHLSELLLRSKRNPINEIRNDYEHIGRILNSRNERAMNAISRNILIAYVNDIRNDYDHIEKIIGSRNERAMNTISRNILIAYVNDIRNDYEHIGRIVDSG